MKLKNINSYIMIERTIKLIKGVIDKAKTKNTPYFGRYAFLHTPHLGRYAFLR